MSKQYLKMVDAFPNNFNINEVMVYNRKSRKFNNDTLEEYVLHAINSHDELVAEIEQLREFKRDAMRYRFLCDNCTTQQADSCGPIFVMTIRQKDNPFNVGLSIDEAMNGSRTDE